jgi:Flp pilus assembly protein TadD
MVLGMTYSTGGRLIPANRNRKGGTMRIRRAAVLAILVAGLLSFGVIRAVFAAGPGTIQGRVVDEQGDPLAGVTVVVTTESSSTPLEATTRKKGSFLVRTPDRGVIYEVRCRLDGFADAVAYVQPTSAKIAFVEIEMARSAAASETAETASPPPTPRPAAQEASEQRQAAIPVFNLGVEALQAGELAVAVEQFRQAAEIDPEFSAPHRALAAIATEREDWAAAAESTERLLELEPDDPEGMRTLYFAVLMLGDTERLAPAARRLAAADADIVEGEMMSHARELFEINQFETARILLAVIVEARPDFAEAYYLLGLCCNSLEDADCARSAFTTFLKLSPDHPDAATARAMLEYLK